MGLSDLSASPDSSSVVSDQLFVSVSLHAYKVCKRGSETRRCNVFAGSTEYPPSMMLVPPPHSGEQGEKASRIGSSLRDRETLEGQTQGAD
jgi:hypothetical protein